MERVVARGACAVAVVMACAVGCDGGGASSGPIALMDLPARAVEAVCSVEAACQIYPDEASCRAAQRSNLDQIQADVAAGKIKYDAVEAGACLDSVTAILACRLSAPRTRAVAACNATFIGSVAAGGACLVNEDCVSSRCSFVNCGTAMCCPGTCDAPQPTGVAIGAACTSSSQCVDGAFCPFAVNGSVCTAVKAAGASCTGSEECVSGTACLPSAAGAATRTCVVPPARGEPCVGSLTCDDRGDFCDPATMKCAARIAPGGACDPMAIGCVLYAACDATTLKCVARGGIGAACTQALPCQSNLTCTNGACLGPLQKPVCPQP
jgi:hypothetical protein